MILWGDEDAPVDGQTSSDAHVAIVNDRFFTCERLKEKKRFHNRSGSWVGLHWLTIGFDLGQDEFFVLQAQLIGCIQLDGLGSGVHGLSERAVRVVSAVHPENNWWEQKKD